jgi:hypothetical protein
MNWKQFSTAEGEHNAPSMTGKSGIVLAGENMRVESGGSRLGQAELNRRSMRGGGVEVATSNE